MRSTPTPRQLASLRDVHHQGFEQLVQAFKAQQVSAQSIAQLLSDTSDGVDQTLTQLWQYSQLPDTLALVAVGGYGRAELFPYSDVDVLILLPDHIKLDEDKALRHAIERFVSATWDLGLRIGSSVRSVNECIQDANSDITIQTAQLESRLIRGDQVLYTQYREQFKQNLNIADFINSKISEMRRRHQKYNNTPYALEPNCKESPGGLRDLHIILWLTKAANLGNNWTELYDNGIATRFELRQLIHNETWLKILRTRLHLIANRAEDRLMFDLQESIAHSMGCHANGQRRASEVLMRRYYRTAKAISQLNAILIMSVAEKLLQATPITARSIDAHYQDKAGMLDILHDDIYRKNPHEILRTFLIFANDPGVKTLSIRTFRALYNARTLMTSRFRDDPINAQNFLAILQAPQNVYRTLELMNQTSVLGRYLLVFQHIVGQMQHDLFHAYTVDQHTMIVLRNMRHFFLPELAHEYPLCSEIAITFDKPWLLYAAALFHDIAKGRGGDHSRLGAQEVRNFAKQHSIEQKDEDFLVFLVKEHLTMSRIAQKEDMGDPEVIDRFVELVKNEQHLNALYLLTVADIRGTSPKVWNSWKAHLLEYLYKITLQVMGGHITNANALIEVRKRLVQQELQEKGLPPHAEKSLWEKLGTSYFMRHESQDISWHTENLYDKTDTIKPIVRVRFDQSSDIVQVLIYTPNQLQLFTRICSYFSSTELSIVNARIHTTIPTSDGHGDRWALDTFDLLLPNDARPENQEEMDDLKISIEENLTHYLTKRPPLPPLPTTRSISRQARYFPLPPVVSITPDEHRQHWLLNITTQDRVGLLYTIARVLSERSVNVDLAKISTLGDRVEDTLQISGNYLNHNHIELEQALIQALKNHSELPPNSLLMQDKEALLK